MTPIVISPVFKKSKTGTYDRNKAPGTLSFLDVKYAESQEYICCQLDALELESTVVNSLIYDVLYVVSAYSASDDILRQYLKADSKW